MTATWSAVGDDARLAERRERSSRIPDLLFGLVLPLGDLNIAFVPVNELAAAAIILLASFRRPRFRLPLMVPVWWASKSPAGRARMAASSTTRPARRSSAPS